MCIGTAQEEESGYVSKRSHAEWIQLVRTLSHSLPGKQRRDDACGEVTTAGYLKLISSAMENK